MPTRRIEATSCRTRVGLLPLTPSYNIEGSCRNSFSTTSSPIPSQHGAVRTLVHGYAPCCQQRAIMRRSPLLRTPRAVLGRGSRALCSLPTAVPQPPPSEDRAAVRVHVKQTTEMLAATVLTPLNARLLGPLERSPFAEGIPLPFVLLLGNHSSGKSSFINFVLGRPVQVTRCVDT